MNHQRYLRLYSSLESDFTERVCSLLPEEASNNIWQKEFANLDEGWKVGEMLRLIEICPTERQGEALSHYYGLAGRDALLSYTKVADELSISPTQARRLVMRAREVMINVFIARWCKIDPSRLTIPCDTPLSPKLALSSEVIQRLRRIDVITVGDLAERYFRLPLGRSRGFTVPYEVRMCLMIHLRDS